MSRPVDTPCGRFSNVAAAARANNMSHAGVYKRAMTERDGFSFATIPAPEKPKEGRRRPIATPDGIFPSVLHAAQALGMSEGTIRKRIKGNVAGWSYVSQ